MKFSQNASFTKCNSHHNLQNCSQSFHLLPPSLLGCFQFKDIQEHPHHLHLHHIACRRHLVDQMVSIKSPTCYSRSIKVYYWLLWPLSLIHSVRASQSQNMFCRLPTFCHRRRISKTPFHTFHFHHFCQHRFFSSNIICDRKQAFLCLMSAHYF